MHSGLGDAILFIPAGTLDDARAVAPDVHCHTENRHPWLALPADVPVYAADYDSAVVWTAPVAARIRDALASGPPGATSGPELRSTGRGPS